MKRHTQEILYHLLPVVFWLLAIGVSVLLYREWQGYVVAVLALISVLIIDRIKRHTDSIEECFQVAVLLGIASYWMPSVLFLIIGIWFYLIYQNLFSFRSFLATLIGLAFVAIWIALGNQLSMINYQLSITYGLYAWIPTAALPVAYIASTTARRILRVR